MGPVLVLAFMFIALFVFAASGIKIVRPHELGLVERLGRYKTTVKPGMRIIFPFFEKMIRVDMRERVIDVPPQEVITEDNVVVSVDAVVFYRATDPSRLVYRVNNFLVAVTKLAQSNLRNVIGDMQLDEAQNSREIINSRLRTILDEATDEWGTKVIRVEIQSIDPPPDVVDSMHHQMKAERTRRAVVTEAQGSREAAVTRATGEKQAAILSAEGRKQGQILEAQGQAEATRAVAEAEKFRRTTVAEGEAEATKLIYGAIHEGRPTNDLIAIKYLEALQKMADGQATKIIIPAESSGFVGALAGMAEMLKKAPGEDSENGNGAGGFPPNPFDYQSPATSPGTIGLMFKQIGRVWRYLGAAIGTKFEEKADPKIQLTQAIDEAQDQHRKLKAQAASVIANQKQTEIRLGRAMGELEKSTRSARQAVILADQSGSKGDSTKAAEYTRLAESLANRMIGLESEVESLKELHLQTTQASDQARAAIEQNAFALQRKLSERQKLLSQLDQAKMQEQVNAAMTQLSESVGSDVPTLDQVRAKIEERYAKALGAAEVMDTSAEMKTLELERISMNAEATARLDQLRGQLGIGSGATAPELGQASDQSATKPKRPRKPRAKKTTADESGEND